LRQEGRSTARACARGHFACTRTSTGCFRSQQARELKTAATTLSTYQDGKKTPQE
jgi:hypothetical protein